MIIPRGTVFGFRYQETGTIDILKALEDIPVLPEGEIAVKQYSIEIVNSEVGKAGEALELAVWKSEYSCIN